ncbi:MAG TPA: NAD(P)/FAD-dependent oxidoreductase [Polyangiales bacterium]|nr:NAD(P)/FAD-dependent oxidoreductase [Polyangiales bacterium]
MAFTGPAQREYDAVVVGSGPNGLSAAVVLAASGLRVVVLEGQSEAGGGMRSAELTLPGFVHDVCSTVHPLGAASPLFHQLDLERHGLTWVHPPAPVAHVLAPGDTVTLERSIDETARQLGRDAAAYRSLVEPFVARFPQLIEMILAPLRWPEDPLLFARFGLHALPSMRYLAGRFREPRAGALLAGIAAHAMLPLEKLVTASFALVLGLSGHGVGWPIARGGSRAICDALLACLRAHGGELVTDHRVHSLTSLPKARAYVLDVTPRQLIQIAGDRLGSSYVARLRCFRYGAGVYKMDWALDGPIPWLDPRCARAGTVHLSGDGAAVSRSEALVARGRLSEAPFVLLVQPTLFDATRAPPGKHIAWAYCHVPHGSNLDASALIEAQIERAAPGFRDLVLGRATLNAVELEQHNPNYVGGDISGGASDLLQLFFRPVARVDPYATPAPDVFVCSSSTPPGGGVHGMCGYWAARSVLSRAFGKQLQLSQLA